MCSHKNFQPGQSLELEIERLLPGGEGFAKVEGLSIFVPQSLPGDRWQVEIISRKPHYARALPRKLIAAGPDRQSPPCEYAPQCGGCQWQDFAYRAQLQSKYEMLVDNLKRQGQLSPKELERVQAVKGMAVPWHYRNKGQFPAQMLQGQITLGLYAPRSHQLVPIEHCLIQHQKINAILQFCQSALRELGITAYDESTQSGLLRHVIVRHGFQSGESLLGLVVTEPGVPALKQLAQKLQQAFPEMVGVIENHNAQAGNRILGPDNRVLAGREYYLEVLDGLEFEVALPAFFQVNPQQTEVLYREVLERLQPTPEMRILDAYCGAGSISLYLARHAQSVVGVESVPEAVDNARNNAARNTLKNLQFYSGRMEDIIQTLAHENFQAAVLDPPRKGCERVVLERLAPLPQLVYVSCNPATLARDTAILKSLGFELQDCQPVDLFPHSHHLETVSHFVKAPSTACA